MLSLNSDMQKSIEELDIDDRNKTIIRTILIKEKEHKTEEWSKEATRLYKELIDREEN